MDKYKDMNPHPLNREEWEQIIRVPAVRELWGLTDETAAEFAAMVYAAKFDFSSGGPGYVGNLYILQGDALTGYPPAVLIQGPDGALQYVITETPLLESTE